VKLVLLLVEKEFLRLEKLLFIKPPVLVEEFDVHAAAAAAGGDADDRTFSMAFSGKA
jgi:hypothetical protein